MPKYKISWTQEQWYFQYVTADSEEQAREMIFDDSFQWPEPYAWEIQDSVEVKELGA